MFSTGNMQKRKWSLHIDPNIDPILDDSKCHVFNLKSSKLGYGVTLNLWHGTNDCSVMLQYQARWVRVTIRTQRENVDMQTNVRCQCSRRHIFDIFKFHRRWHPCMSLKGHSNGNIIMEILIPTKSMYSDTEPACTHETHNCEALRMDTRRNRGHRFWCPFAAQTSRAAATTPSASPREGAKERMSGPPSTQWMLQPTEHSHSNPTTNK